MKFKKYFLLFLILILPIVIFSQSKSNECSIYVDVKKEIKKINKNIFGFNLEWIEDGNLIWNKATSSFNECLMTEIQPLRSTVLRFPGGVFSDFYHWQDGIGPQINRPKRQAHTFDTRVFENNFGTDEFLTLCSKLSAEPLITINVGTGSKEEAIEWVKYCNLRNKPKKVQLWELGNELYMNSDETSRSISMKPEDYALKVKEFSQEMRKIDPNIKIAAIGGANTKYYALNQYPNWDKVILEQAGSCIDFLSVHNAYYPAVVDRNDYKKEEVYAALLGADSLIKENLEQLDKEIELYAKDYKNKIKIAVTEWAPLFTWSPDSPYFTENKSLGSALYVATVLKTFIESKRVEVANFFKLSGTDFMALNQCGKKSALWYVFKIFRESLGSVLIESRCICPTYDTNARIGLVAPIKGIPIISAMATKDANGNLCIIVINKSLNQDYNCNFVIAGLDTMWQGQVIILAGQNISDKEGIIKASTIKFRKQLKCFVPRHSLVWLKLQDIGRK